jgi:hypothetical protein
MNSEGQEPQNQVVAACRERIPQTQSFSGGILQTVASFPRFSSNILGLLSPRHHA